MLVLKTSSEIQTQGIGARLAMHLRIGDCIAVHGELGAGKTTFIRGSCEALGVKDRVTSPTFAIGHRYSGNIEIAHLDLYRFESISFSEWADIEPLLDSTLIFVEWPNIGLEFLPCPRVEVTIRHISEENREVEIICNDTNLLKELANEVARDFGSG